MFNKATSTEEDTMAPPERPPLTRKSHVCFIAKIYVISTILLVCALLQWSLTIKLENVTATIRGYNFMILLFILVAFLILMCYRFFFRSMIKKSLVLVIVCTLLAVEFGTVVFIRPIAEAVTMDLIYSAILTTAAILLSALFSFFKISPADVNNDTNFLAEWTVRCFLISSIGVVVVMALRSPYFEMGVVVTIMIIHCFIFYKTVHGKVA